MGKKANPERPYAHPLVISAETLTKHGVGPCEREWREFVSRVVEGSGDDFGDARVVIGDPATLRCFVRRVLRSAQGNFSPTWAVLRLIQTKVLPTKLGQELYRTLMEHRQKSMKLEEEYGTKAITLLDRAVRNRRRDQSIR